MGLFGNKSFNKKKAPVRKTVSLNNLSQNPTVRAADLHPDPENVSLYDSYKMTHFQLRLHSKLGEQLYKSKMDKS